MKKKELKSGDIIGSKRISHNEKIPERTISEPNQKLCVDLLGKYLVHFPAKFVQKMYGLHQEG